MSALHRRVRLWSPWTVLLAYVGWTALTVSGMLGPLDRALAAPTLDPSGSVVELADALGRVFGPVLLYAGLLVLAWWAWRRRLRELAMAIVLATVLSWVGWVVVKLVLALPRPADMTDLAGGSGGGYPSGHVAAATTVVVMGTATLVTIRQTLRLTRGWWIGGSVVVVATGVERWLLGAHGFSGIVGGVLWGTAAALLALLFCRVHLDAARPVPEDTGEDAAPRPRAAVIYNPRKVTDLPTFMRRVDYELESRGWAPALWLPTTAQDPGRAMAATAVREQVDLVIGAGGDGTVRVIAAGLADTGIPFAVVAAGTGNLLARNVGIPMDEVRALAVAFEGADRRIDLIRVHADDKDPDYACAFAGIGFDAAIVEAQDDLKRALGSSAYVLEAARHADHQPVEARISIDGAPEVRTRAHLVLLGNIGLIQGGIHLFPGARPDDGELDLLVASPRRIGDWLTLLARVALRRERGDDRLTRSPVRRLEVSVDPPDRYELDGDPQGTCSRLVAEVVPGALVLRVPR